MITDKVIFMETIPTMAFGNVRMGLEGTLEPGETELEAWRQAKKKINEAYKDMYPVNPENNGWEKFPEPEFTNYGVEIRKVDIPAKIEADKEFEEFKKHISTLNSVNDAEVYRMASPFKYSIEAHNYINSFFKDAIK